MKKPSLFLILLAAALLIPALILSVSAEPGEIEDLSYQTLSGADVLDDDTDLRFVFTVGSLGYSEVGVVCSKTVAAIAPATGSIFGITGVMPHESVKPLK